LAALLSRLIDYPMDPLQALAQPRFLLGKTFSNAPNAIGLKADIAPEVREALALRGHAIRMVDAHSPLVGHPGALALDAVGGMRGAHDPRSDGYAIGCA
jgi:gamma-glutamyltranspeptidase/glutathione hydrolase